MRSNNPKMKEPFKQFLSETKRRIDTELSLLIQNLSGLKLHPQIKYAVTSNGKRLRPILVILSAQSIGRNGDDIIPLALAFELMHTATLIHDDIIDEDETRRGRTALHKKWSCNDAILTGDALIALSISLSSRYGQEIIQSAAKCALELCDGEHIDANSFIKTATEESYFEMIKKKTASLFRESVYCGALAGGATASEALALSNYGENLGIAYQLDDDLHDIKSSIQSLTNSKPQRITLPLIHLYKKSDSKTREELEKNLVTAKRYNEPIEVEKIEEMLQQAGSIDYCKRKIGDYLQESLASITQLKQSESKSHLVQLTDFVAAQQKTVTT